MIAIKRETTTISIPAALQLVGLVGGAWAILTIVGAVLAYLPDHPEFTPLNTYLSDIGDTAGWPQIIFNSGTLMAVPMRFLALVLLALRLTQLGAGRAFTAAVLVIGFFATSGTALMTATPFSVAPTVHKAGIGLYFLGVVVLQSIIGAREWTLAKVPRLLPLLSLAMVLLFLVFVTLMLLYEGGSVGRSTPVIWEWLAVTASIAWLVAHGLLLGESVER